MAYLRKIYRQKCNKCGYREPAQELVTLRNDIYGRYCNNCAPGMLNMVLIDEQREQERRAGHLATTPAKPAAEPGPEGEP